MPIADFDVLDILAGGIGIASAEAASDHDPQPDVGEVAEDDIGDGEDSDASPEEQALRRLDDEGLVAEAKAAARTRGRVAVAEEDSKTWQRGSWRARSPMPAPPAAHLLCFNLFRMVPKVNGCIVHL